MQVQNVGQLETGGGRCVFYSNDFVILLLLVPKLLLLLLVPKLLLLLLVPKLPLLLVLLVLVTTPPPPTATPSCVFAFVFACMWAHG